MADHESNLISEKKFEQRSSSPSTSEANGPGSLIGSKPVNGLNGQVCSAKLDQIGVSSNGTERLLTFEDLTNPMPERSNEAHGSQANDDCQEHPCEDFYQNGRNQSDSTFDFNVTPNFGNDNDNDCFQLGLGSAGDENVHYNNENSNGCDMWNPQMPVSDNEVEVGDDIDNSNDFDDPMFSNDEQFEDMENRMYGHVNGEDQEAVFYGPQMPVVFPPLTTVPVKLSDFKSDFSEVSFLSCSNLN